MRTKTETNLLKTMMEAIRIEIERMSPEEACDRLNVFSTGLETIKKRNTWTLGEVCTLFEKLDLRARLTISRRR